MQHRIKDGQTKAAKKTLQKPSKLATPGMYIIKFRERRGKRRVGCFGALEPISEMGVLRQGNPANQESPKAYPKLAKLFFLHSWKQSTIAKKVFFRFDDGGKIA